MSQFCLNPELMDLRSSVGRPQYISHEQKMLMKWRKQSLLNQHQRCHSLGSSPLTRGLPGVASTKKPGAIKSSDVLSPRYLATPLRSPHISRILGKEVKTPNTCGKKTPKNSGLLKTPLLLRSAKEPRLKANSTSKTPRTAYGATGDRFIPMRAAVDKEAGYFMIMRAKSASDADDLGSVGYQQQVSDALGVTAIESNKILHFSQNAPPCLSSSHDVLFRIGSGNNSFGSCGKRKETSVARIIPSRPERILDAPDVINDYYLNLLSWSSSNVVSVALNGGVFLWNASNNTVTELFDLEPSQIYVSSVSWMPDSNILAVGTSAGAVQIWDVGREKMLRTMAGHVSRVGSLSWNSHILSSGCRSGAIHNHDVRVADHHVGTLLSHMQEVCGLQWSPDGSYLASGGNDNLANIWDAVSGNSRAPVHRLTGHRAAVKAVAWCPWQHHILATGSGSADGFIRFWNVNSGSLLHEIDTGSQISSILWSKYYHELVSGHGFNKNQLTVWKYPSMVKCAELLGHSDRVLGLALSPDGAVVASIAADETIRLWKCFETDAKQRKHSQSQKIDNSSILGKSMLR